MRFFVFLSVIFGFSSLVFAQAENALFPEFSNIIESETQAKETMPDIEAEEEVIFEEEPVLPEASDEEDLFAVKEEANVQPVEEELPEKEEEETDKEQKIYLGISEANSTLTPNRNMSFCSAVLSLKNRTKKELLAFSGTFKVGEYTKSFNFTSVKKGEETTDDFYFVGESCEDILATPVFEIKTCKIQDWSDKKCRSRVEIVPITSEGSF